MQSKLSYSEVLPLNKDHKKAAKTARLVYVNDTMPGIKRIRRGKGFSYYYNSQKICDKDELQRIKKIVIPPAWTNVWICSRPDGHLQATGYDARHRKQYKYHPLWNETRNETKFHRLYKFGKHLPAIREKLREDSRKRLLSREKVLAVVISLMEKTYIRIGSEDYQRLYGSYGITTFENKHVKIDGHKLRFSFKGKKGKTQNVTLKSKRLTKAVRQCKDIPGRELFQYYDQEGKKHAIDSGMVNEYIKEAAGADFTAKDFRTWAGTLNMLNVLKTLHDAGQSVQTKLLRALDDVSRKLGNTRAVCRKYYVHPGIIKMYEENNLDKYLEKWGSFSPEEQQTGLTCEEKILLKILRKLLP